jgi:DNA repair protein RadC
MTLYAATDFLDSPQPNRQPACVMASLTIQEMPEQDRPREKLARLGASALSDSELIAILLRVGVRGENAVDVARRLLLQYQSLDALARCSVGELAKNKGVGLAKATQLAAAFGLGNRLARERLTKRRIDSPELVCDLLGAEMRALTKESLRVILLDARHHLLRVEQVALGSLNESVAHPREIFEPAVRFSAFAMIVVHNHPSGDPTPSDADHRLTRRLAEAAQILQIGLLDHVIIGTPAEGRPAYCSFKEMGVL